MSEPEWLKEQREALRGPDRLFTGVPDHEHNWAWGDACNCGSIRKRAEAASPAADEERRLLLESAGHLAKHGCNAYHPEGPCRWQHARLTEQEERLGRVALRPLEPADPIVVEAAAPAALDVRCQQDDAGRPCGRHLERGECSVHGRAAWPNPDACCSRNAFEDGAHSPTCPNATDYTRAFHGRAASPAALDVLTKPQLAAVIEAIEYRLFGEDDGAMNRAVLQRALARLIEQEERP